MNLPLLIILLALFVVIIISYSIKGADFVAISLFCMFLGAGITGIQLGIGINEFILDVEWQAVIIILSMSIITKIAQDSNVLEYVAVKLFKLSRGDRRLFLYLLCRIYDQRFYR